MAPELWQDKPCSRKSDVYAIGVVLYELCALKFPYDANDMDELENKVLKEKYSIPITVNKEFKSIIQKCLQKKPEQRPTIEEIIMDDVFQRKAQLNRITLPLQLNKLKQQKIKVQDDPDQSMQAEPENQLSLSQRKLSCGEFAKTGSEKNLLALGRSSPRNLLSARRESTKVPLVKKSIKIDTKVTTQKEKDLLKEKVVSKVVGKRLLTSRANAPMAMTSDTSDLIFGKNVEEEDVVD